MAFYVFEMSPLLLLYIKDIAVHTMILGCHEIDIWDWLLWGTPFWLNVHCLISFTVPI